MSASSTTLASRNVGRAVRAQQHEVLDGWRWRTRRDRGRGRRTRSRPRRGRGTAPPDPRRAPDRGRGSGRRSRAGRRPRRCARTRPGRCSRRCRRGLRRGAARPRPCTAGIGRTGAPARRPSRGRASACESKIASISSGRLRSVSVSSMRSRNSPSVVAGEEPVEEHRARATDVQVARRRGREADTDGIRGHRPGYRRPLCSPASLRSASGGRPDHRPMD